MAKDLHGPQNLPACYVFVTHYDYTNLRKELESLPVTQHSHQVSWKSVNWFRNLNGVTQTQHGDFWLLWLSSDWKPEEGMPLSSFSTDAGWRKYYYLQYIPADVQQCDYIYKHPQHVIFEMHYVLPCSRFTFLLNDTIIVRSN